MIYLCMRVCIVLLFLWIPIDLELCLEEASQALAREREKSRERRNQSGLHWVLCASKLWGYGGKRERESDHGIGCRSVVLTGYTTDTVIEYVTPSFSFSIFFCSQIQGIHKFKYFDAIFIRTNDPRKCLVLHVHMILETILIWLFLDGLSSHLLKNHPNSYEKF